jgi:DMSO reductase family type II enzyme heme b subunit
VYKRALATSDPNDVQLKAGAVPIAFAVWDGQNLERDGMKGISTWFTLQIPEATGGAPEQKRPSQ